MDSRRSVILANTDSQQYPELDTDVAYIKSEKAFRANFITPKAALLESLQENLAFRPYKTKGDNRLLNRKEYIEIGEFGLTALFVLINNVTPAKDSLIALKLIHNSGINLSEIVSRIDTRITRDRWVVSRNFGLLKKTGKKTNNWIRNADALALSLVFHASYSYRELTEIEARELVQAYREYGGNVLMPLVARGVPIHHIPSVVNHNIDIDITMAIG